jgi:hypothetical protein
MFHREELAVNGSRVLVIAALVVAAPICYTAADVPETLDVPSPTFAADVAPIVYANCVTCHRPGQAAPFSLLTYDDVRKHAKTIVDVTGRRYMPPWHASRAEGFPEFRDERHLSDEDIATLKRWYDLGMPEGNLTAAPPPPKFPDGWTLGTPDLVLKLPQPIAVPAEGPDQFRNVVLPIDLPEDRFITAIDFEPSARKVLHHALFFAGPASTTVRDDDVLPGLSLGQRLGGGAGAGGPAQVWTGIGGWVPGMTPRFFPDGIAQPLAKHSNVVAQLHLHPSGKPEQEQGQLAVYFAKTPPEKSLTSVQVPPMFGFAMGINIPPDERHYVVKDSFVLPVDIEAYGARGHAHYLCREMKMTATLPDGSTRGLLWIKDWDFGWQDSYFYKAPFQLPRGTKIDVELVYDNSDENPRNPTTPPRRVTWGRESFDEMGSMSLIVASPSGTDGQLLRQAQAQHFREQFIRMMTGR